MEIVQVNQAEMLQAINRSEVDMQISTAKAYPRDVQAAIKRIEDLASLDRETAEDCFYVLRRNGATGQTTIEGLSVRMAEIIAGAWGNLRVQARIIGNDGKTITAQAVCHDLETNFAVSVEVKRRITDKQGKTYSEDLQVVTGNAACAIAFRNAVLKVVPKAITKKAINNIKQVALGKALDVETSRQNCIANFAKIGVTTEMLCQYLDIKSVEEIGKEQIFELRATWNAIKEGTTSVQETFVQPQEEKRIAEKAKSKAQGAKERAQQAIARQKQNNATGNDLELNNEQ
jgi:phosphoribosylformylglycinamidine (FGAM) synthase PurS component